MSDAYLKGIEATVDITQGSPEQYPYLSDDTITLSASDHGYTLGSNVSITGIGIPWRTSGTGTGVGYDPTWNNNASTKIQLNGPGADIEINGESLVGMLKQIEQRLNILKPNPELEKDWEELRALGDQYRELEAKIQAKMETWEKLSKKY